MLYNVDQFLTVNPVNPVISEPAGRNDFEISANKVTSYDGFTFWEIKVQDANKFNKYFAPEELEKDEALFRASLQAAEDGRRKESEALLNEAVSESVRLRR